jgi:uncharacterized membrane protein YkoI
MGRLTAVVAMASAVLLSQSLPLQAQGQSSDQPSGSAPPAAASPVIVPTGQVLNEDQIREKLREEGYVEVKELRLQGPSYEAKAVRDGRNVNLTVDARTGSIRSTY